MTPQTIVNEIGQGLTDALKISNLLLGVERSISETADIHPEYVTTVKVAERLLHPDREIAMEAHIEAIRGHLGRVARLQALGDSARFAAVGPILKAHTFVDETPGQIGTKRIDILVKDSDTSRPPLLMVEAKLGISNVAGVKKDVDRLVNLLHMHQKVGLHPHVYGAAVFHLLAVDGDATKLATRGANFAAKIQAHVDALTRTHPWLVGRADLIAGAAVVEGVTTYDEHFEGDVSQTLFGKAGYAFAPGLVLLGADADIRTVNF